MLGARRPSPPLLATPQHAQVLYPDPRPETVFESGELGAEAVTGMWGLRRRPGEHHHSLVVISFVGGTRALQLDGEHSELTQLSAQPDRS